MVRGKHEIHTSIDKQLKNLAIKLKRESLAIIKTVDILSDLKEIYLYNNNDKIAELAIELSHVKLEQDPSIIEMRRWLRHMIVYIEDRELSELTEFGDTPNEIRQKLFGYIIISNKKGMDIETVYMSFLSSYPGYLKNDVGNTVEQLREILRVIMGPVVKQVLHKDLIDKFKNEIRSTLAKLRIINEDWYIDKEISVVQLGENGNINFIDGKLKSFTVSNTGLEYTVASNGFEYHCKDFDEAFIFNELGVR